MSPQTSSLPLTWTHGSSAPSQEPADPGALLKSPVPWTAMAVTRLLPWGHPGTKPCEGKGDAAFQLPTACQQRMKRGCPDPVPVPNPTKPEEAWPGATAAAQGDRRRDRASHYPRPLPVALARETPRRSLHANKMAAGGGVRRGGGLVGVRVRSG